MGVPAFFRWLSAKYPSVIRPCNEHRMESYGGGDYDFDNLYLDMNGYASRSDPRRTSSKSIKPNLKKKKKKRNRKRR